MSTTQAATTPPQTPAPAAGRSPVAQPPATQPARGGEKRKYVVDLSSLPLQILLHLNVYYFTAFWFVELALYVYKGVVLPFPDVGGTLALEIVLLVFIAVIE